MNNGIDTGLYETSDAARVDDILIPKGLSGQRIFHMPMHEESSLFDAFQFCLNTAIGSGTLMVPYCYTAGVGLYLIISLIFAVICYFTLAFLAESGYFVHAYDYRGLFAFTFGKSKVWIVNCIILCVQIGAATIYFLWNGRLMPKLLGTCDMKPPLSSYRFWTVLVSLTCAIPLVCLKSIHVLEKLSILCSVTTLLLIVHAFYWLIVHIKVNGFDPQHKFCWFNFNHAAITSFSINTMAYNCHLNFFSALEPMRKATVGRARKLARTTVISAFVLYNVYGIVTYLDLFDRIRGSSLEYYYPGNIFTKVTLIGLIFMLVVSVPLILWAARFSLIHLIWKDEQTTTLKWILIGVVLSVVSTGLATISKNIIIFFEIVGGVFTPILIYFMPSVFYIKNQRYEPKWRIIVAWFIAFFTIVTICVSLYQTGYDVYREIKEKSDK